ncbi:MAG: RelA/SpoT family protein [Candidatus Promineifilaceae bacterium]
MFVASAGSEAAQINGNHVSEDGRQFFELVDSYLNHDDRLLIREAFALARQEHGDQRRQSGELFFTHPLTVAYYLAEYRLDAPALAAALLHDVAEDTLVSVGQIGQRFGPDVSRLVDGVTKLKEVTAGVARGRRLSPEEIQDASLHKMFDAMTADVRVVLIKLFDRLHNMRTISALSEGKQERKASETLAVYAPLANRLGIWRLKTELEALSLEVLDPEAYMTIKLVLEHQFLLQQPTYALIIDQVIAYLQDKQVTVANVVPSPESIFSLYRFLSARSMPYDSLENPLRVVVLVEDVPSCYLALGYIHQLWRPVPGKFDDYIALPRENLYRALHTTVIHDSGQPLKIRFRSVDMNEVSEIGVLAKWVYSGTPMWSKGINRRVEALFASISENINLEPQNYSTGVKSVVEDVFRQQVMIYTPRGDIIELPQGSTPVDFAYAIHSEVGNQCQLAYVNERLYPLNRPLSDGDRVRIVKSGWARPQRTWLDEDLGFLTTSRARAHVRRWFRRLSKSVAVAEGRRLLKDELEMLGMSSYSPEDLADQFGFETMAELHHALGRAELLPTEVATSVLALAWHHEPQRNIGSTVKTNSGQEYVITNSGGRRLRLCQACNARPGDAIVGFLRNDGGVTVHKEGCYTLRPDPMSDRTIKLAWGRKGEDAVRIVRIQIDVYDRAGLLFEIAELFQNENVNIGAINTAPSPGEGKVRLILELEIVSPRQLVRILHRAHALVNVYAVRCLPSNGQLGADNGTGTSSYLPE